MSSEYRTFEETRVLKLARRYARAKLLGINIEKGGISRLDPRQKDDLVAYYAKQLLDAAEHMIQVMTADEVEGVLIE